MFVEQKTESTSQMLVPSLKKEKVQLRNGDTINKMCIRAQENGVIKEIFMEEAVPVLGPEDRQSLGHLGILSPPNSSRSSTCPELLGHVHICP